MNVRTGPVLYPKVNTVALDTGIEEANVEGPFLDAARLAQFELMCWRVSVIKSLVKPASVSAPRPAPALYHRSLLETAPPRLHVGAGAENEVQGCWR